MISVDTSLDWITLVKKENINHAGKICLKHVDLGKVAEWGYPTSYEKRDIFSQYTDGIWTESSKPDTVLIDGRFRVCCFFTSLKYAPPGTRILFDDYVNRPIYHVIEKYVERKETCGRQCLFEVPKINQSLLEQIEQEIINFRHVFP